MSYWSLDYLESLCTQLDGVLFYLGENRSDFQKQFRKRDMISSRK